MIEDDENLVQGLPPLDPLPTIPVGKLIYEQLITNCVDSPALIDASTGGSISYKEILSKTCSLAECLRKWGYGESTMITISSENCVEFFVPIIAALYIGATVAPINHTYTQQEIVHALDIAKPQIIFCSKQTYPAFVELKKRLRFIEKILVINGDDSSEHSVESFVFECLRTKQPLYRFDLANVDDEKVAFILYSSGTTGLPKGVMITQKNLLVRFKHSDDPRLSPQEKGRSTFGLLPFFHAYGLFVGLGAIYKSTKVIIMTKFDEKLFLSCIEKYKITGLPLVPPLAVLLAKSPLVEKYDLSSVQQVVCGAAPLSKEVEDLLKKRLKVDAIKQGYGLTESTLSVVGFPLNESKSGSSGKVLPYIVCKIRDPETGKSLGPNQVGEVCIKGPLVMKGYYGNEEATRNTFTKDGWLLTGDLAYYDKENYFFIVGRLKELIKYKGFQVPPAELEAILLTNPKIKDVAVIGAPDEEAGELPLAFVVPHDGKKITEKEVQNFLNKKVSSHKRLRGGVVFVSEIPKNPSGKILRRKLHEILNKHLKSKL